MSKFGSVAGVAVDGADGRSAIVLFEEERGVSAALAAARAGKVVKVAEADLPPLEGRPIGLKAWVEGHKGLFPGTEALQAEVKGNEKERAGESGGVGFLSTPPVLTSLPPIFLPPIHVGRRLDGRL